ncbi:MAG: host specificity protein, partial [Pseudomonadota bacterium]
SLPGPMREEAYRIERIVTAEAREIEAVRIDPALYRTVSAPESRVETALPRLPGPLTAILLDLPRAEGVAGDAWPHLAVAADPWPGPVALYRATTGADFRQIATLGRPAFIGHLTEALPPGHAELWQRVTVEAVLPTGALGSVEALAVLNGANALAVEAAPGVWEIVQTRDAVLVAPGRYRLGPFLRGRRGTEALAGTEIPAGARLVVLDEGVVPVETALELRGLARSYRAGPASRALTDKAYVAFEATTEAIGLRPFTPAHLRAREDEGALHLTWIRRTRIGGDTWTTPDVPLGETRERYRVRVLRAGQQLRQVETDTPSWTYTAAQRAADGSGPLTLRVAQISDTWGPGPEREITHA